MCARDEGQFSIWAITMTEATRAAVWRYGLEARLRGRLATALHQSL